MSDLPQLQPLDQHNRRLRSNVGPADWNNPVPSGRYHLVVIGAGTAGLVTAAGAAGLGAKIALIERELMGGDCLNVGCVPSKALISAARRAVGVRQADDLGIRVSGDVDADFPAVMERMRSLRADISPHDSAARFTELGIDVYFGSAQFTGNRSVRVGDQELSYRRAVVCTGGRAAELPIPGLRDVDALTNETVFSLTELPRRLAVIGAGPIGCELAQSFAALGSEVTLVQKADRILPREDPDASAIVQDAMQRDGVRILMNASTTRAERSDGAINVWYDQDGSEHSVSVDRVLVGAGRTPNVDGLGLEVAGVRFDSQNGIDVNDRLQTSNPDIYAAGDVCSRFKFTHAADFMARIVIQNTLFYGRAKLSDLTIPWCTYTTPELAHVGLLPEAARRQGIETDTYTVSLSDVDRAILSGETDGFVRAHTKKGTDEIVGATIVANHAGDMIGEITLAMTLHAGIPKWKRWLRLSRGVGLGAIAKTIHPYPTTAEAIRKLGDQYNRMRLTPFVKRLFGFWLKWTR